MVAEVEGLSERELNALPAWMATALRMLAEGRSRTEVKKATGAYLYRLDDLVDDARLLLTNVGLETLEAEREEERCWEAGYRELGVLPTATHNCLRRNGYKRAADVRAATDAELLALRNFGRTNLRYVRQHFPHTPPEAVRTK